VADLYGVLTVLLNVYGTGSPNLALELDRDGEVIAKPVLSLACHDAEDDEYSDLAEEEEPLVWVDPYAEGARLAKTFECHEPFAHDGLSARCGRTLVVTP